MTRLSTYVAQPRTFEDLNTAWKTRFEFKNDDEIVKIAILDTGVDLLHEDFLQNARAAAFENAKPKPAQGEISQIERMPIKSRKNFCGEDERNVQDLDGHGTSVASIILRLAPRAELCVARICDGDINRGLSEDQRQMANEVAYTRHPRPATVVKVSLYLG